MAAMPQQPQLTPEQYARVSECSQAIQELLQKHDVKMDVLAQIYFQPSELARKPDEQTAG